MDPNTQTPTPNTPPDNQPDYTGQDGSGSAGSAQPQPGSVTPPAPVGGPSAPSGQPAPTPGTGLPGTTDSTYGGGSFSTSPVPASGGGRSKKLLMIIILVIVVIALGVGGYFGYKALKKQNQKDTVSNALNQSNAKSKVSGATDISTLNSLTFNLPASAVSGLTAGPSANPNAKLYETSDGNCVFLYGTGNASFLPGSSVSDITNAYLDNIRKIPNATVTGPTAADPRIIPDASNASKKYSISSLTFTVVQSNKAQTKGYYSAALIKNQDRVIVETACTNPDGAVDQSRMDSLEAAAKQLTITVNK